MVGPLCCTATGLTVGDAVDVSTHVSMAMLVVDTSNGDADEHKEFVIAPEDDGNDDDDARETVNVVEVTTFE